MRVDIMGNKKTESCGRCSVTTVLDSAEATRTDDEAGGTNPFDGERIEIEESTIRSVVRHEVAVRRLKDRLDSVVTRLTWGTEMK